MTPILATATIKPAGGAALDEVAIVTGFVALAWGALLWMGHRHRQGRRTPLGLAAALAARVSGLPAWAALPLLVAGLSLAGVYAGFMWDTALHIDRGRDTGPLANPAHYVMLLGLYGIFAAGFLAMVLPRRGETPSPSAVPLSPTWRAPVGGLLIAVAGTFAFLGFPLDDAWHRLFGQDVTLWGPTHLIMLGGAVLSLIGVALLFEDGARARPPRLRALTPPAIRVAVMAALLVGLSAFPTEFDYGVPQYPLVLQPMLIALSAGVVLVAARLWAGPGGALGAVMVYLGARAAVAVLVGPVLGETTPAMPLFVAEALCVELAALALGRRRPLALGAVAGLLIGTAGFAAEWAWTHAVMPIPWTSALLPEGPIAAVAAGLAGGLVGALLGSGLRGELPRPAVARGVALGALVALGGLLAGGLVPSEPRGVRATVALEEVRPAPEREVLATVRFHPRGVAEGATWVRAIAWQGGGRIGFPLKRLAEGVYRTPEPLPVHGEWKTVVRILNGRTMLGLPIYLPGDRAIPAAAVPAPPRFTRPMEPDRRLLQRERKRGVPAWLWSSASLAVLALYLAFLSVLAWGVDRFARAAGAARGPLDGHGLDDSREGRASRGPVRGRAARPGRHGVPA